MRKKETRQLGFTLMDVMVSVGVITVLMGVVTTIMLNSFKAKTKMGLMEIVNQNGIRAMVEIRKNIINALEGGVICPVGVGSSLSVVGVDGQTSYISCTDGSNIASASATNGMVELTNSEVELSSCGNFISCDASPADSSVVSKVKISFSVSAGEAEAGVGGYVGKDFDLEVTVRD